MSSEFFFNIRLEGETTFKLEPGTVMPDSTGEGVESKVRTRVVIEAGLTDWKDDPYRVNVFTKFLECDADDAHDERRFKTAEELCTWLESYVAELTQRGFQTVRYKANVGGSAIPIDWLNHINLPESE